MRGFLGEVGQRVTIDSGRWRDRTGEVIGHSTIFSRQERVYPVVKLDDGGGLVRVVSVSPIEDAT